MSVDRERGARITRMMLQQVAEAEGRATSFTITSGGATWDFAFGASFIVPNKQALPKK